MKKKLNVFLIMAFVFCAAFMLNVQTSQAAPKRPKLNVKKLNLTLNSSFHLRVYNLNKNHKVVFSTSNADIVSVSQIAPRKASITAVSLGNCSINVQVKKGKKVVRRLKCKVTVSPTPFSIKFARRNLLLQVDTRYPAKTIIKPVSSEEKPLFDTSNSSIATINSRGVITAIAPGTVTIKATLLSTGQTATCTVTVTENQMPDAPDNMKKKHSEEIPIL